MTPRKAPAAQGRSNSTPKVVISVKRATTAKSRGKDQSEKQLALEKTQSEVKPRRSASKPNRRSTSKGPNALMERLGLMPEAANAGEVEAKLDKLLRKSSTKLKRNRSNTFVSTGDEGTKPINIKISKAQKIKNLFARKLTQAASAMNAEKLEQFPAPERLFHELAE